MTINVADNTPRVSYSVAEGVTQTSFAVSFEFFNEADLNVYVDGTLKTLTTDYTVSGGSGSTGTVTISVTGATGGSTVVITRDIALERTTDFPASGAFQIASLNTELDKLIAITADLDDKASRALQLTDYDTAVSLVLPDVDTRKGTVLAFNSSTGAVEAGPITSNVNTLADISDDIATLADIEDGTDATDAIQTVAGISSNVTTVAGISSNVTTVAGISSDVTAVAGDATDIGTVATNIANVNTVAGQTTNLQNVTDNLTAIQNAATNASNAATSASNASTSATNASNAQTAAETAQTGAETAQTAAESARDSALAAYDNFDDRYLGVKASDPTLDNDGNALVAGALYFNSTDSSMKVYDGSDWYDAYADGALFARKANNLSDLADAATARTNLGLGTAATSASTDFVAVTGDAMTGDLTFGDSNKAVFGAGGDLEVFHNASNSYVKDVGTGKLHITSDGTGVSIDKGTSELMATFDTDGAVTLYYDAAAKLATTSYGLDISGSVVADTQTAGSITGATTLDFATYQNFVLTLTGNTTLSNPTTEKVGQSGFISITQTGGYTLSLGTDYETAGGAGITLSASGTDLIPYLVIASGRILLGAPQLAFA